MPIFGKAKKKKKQRRIPDNLVTIGRFEYTFPMLRPESYLDHLEQTFKENLIQISLDGNLGNAEPVPHTRFGVRNSELWFVGTVDETDDMHTRVSGTVGELKGYLLFWLLIAVITAGSILDFYLNDLPIPNYSEGVDSLSLLVMLLASTIATRIRKRKTLRLFRDVPHNAQRDEEPEMAGAGVAHFQETTSDTAERQTQEHR